MTHKPLLLNDILKAEDNNFGVLRLAMALAVLVSHSYWLATGQVALEPLHSWTGFTLGEHAVQVFFFLSGVVVAQSIMKSGSLFDFAIARALRIFPGLIACVVATAFILGPLVTDLTLRQYFADKGVITYLVQTISLATGSAPLPGVFTDVPLANFVNLSLWTLKYEVACYILLGLFGVVYLRFERLRPMLVMLLSVAVVAAFAGPARPVEPLSGLGSLRYFVVFFFAGTLAYLARERLVISWLALPPLFALFLLALKSPFAELASALFLGYATLCIAALPMPGLRAFTNSQDYSYGVYILHCPIQQAIVDLKPGISPIELTLVALATVVPLSVLLWNAVEHPSMNCRRQIVAGLRALFARLLVRAPKNGESGAVTHPSGTQTGGSFQLAGQPVRVHFSVEPGKIDVREAIRFGRPMGGFHRNY